MNYYNLDMSKSNLSRTIHDCYQLFGRRRRWSSWDDLKELGFKIATIAGLSFSKNDLKVPDQKAKILEKTQGEVDKSRSSTSEASSPRARGTTRSSTSGPTPPSRSARRC